MQDKRGHSHTINNLHYRGETSGGETVRVAGKLRENHVDVIMLEAKRGRHTKREDVSSSPED